MSRAFVRASSEDLTIAAAPVTAAPLTLACWFNVLDVTNQHTLVSLVNSGGPTSDYFALVAEGNTAGDPVAARLNSTAGNNAVAVTSTGFSASTWRHGAAVFASSASRTAYLNGASPGSDTTSITPSGVNALHVGSRTLNFTDGRIAEVGIWAAALDAGEVLALARGVSPILIRPQSLVGYWPLFGNDSPEPDRWNGRNDLTLTNAPTKGDHVPMLYPTRRRVTSLVATVPRTVTGQMLAVF